MKGCFPLIILLLSRIAFANSLHALVFEFSPDTKATLSEDGWVKMSFDVVNYGPAPLNIRFSALCAESGLELPHYPHDIKMTLQPDAAQTITVFMNSRCGSLDNLPAGIYSRTIQYKFINLDTREELSFDQQYAIEVEKKLVAGTSRR